jgi:hypothetical protein
MEQPERPPGVAGDGHAASEKGDRHEYGEVVPREHVVGDEVHGSSADRALGEVQGVDGEHEQAVEDGDADEVW